ncbi:uncharacterized protein LOC134459901 [Engraulis encrasicolus]|uniref:uncharacterized protein LOC134459901 n=1 Tax=Engraulis encrasicolus TaxID=184585 RepID=UPI002FD45125
MEKINRYLKNVFIGINVVLAVAAGVAVILIGKFNVGFNSKEDMDILFTENRLFKETILLSEDLMFARAVICICCAGMLIVACLGIYGAKKEVEWPFAVFITACSIGMVTFLMQGLRVNNLKFVIMKYMSEKRSKFLTLEAAIPLSFALAALELVRIILATVMIRQLQKRPAAIPPAASGGTKPSTDAELCQVSTPETSEFNSKDTQKLVEN